MKINKGVLAISSFCAGIIIGLSTYISLLADNKYIAGIILTFGILFTNLLRLDLFTCNIGFYKNKKEIPYLLLFLIFNIIGVFFISSILKLTIDFDIIYEKCLQLTKTKLETSLFIHYSEAMLYGMMLFISIVTFRIYNSYICILLPITICAITGFEHSITDSFYYIFSGNFLKALNTLIITILGNITGALFLKYMLVYNKKEELNNNEVSEHNS